MKLFKAAIGALLSLAVCTCASVAVSADTDDTARDISVSIAQTAMDSGDALNSDYDFKNDPAFGKYRYMIKQRLLSGEGLSSGSNDQFKAFYGSDKLTHNSRFDNVSKDYGIDISYYQSYGRTINWSSLKAEGVKFVIVRIGYRGYGSEGTLVMDPDFHKNIKAAIDNGFEVGAYFYTQAISYSEAAEEAEFCADLLKNYDLDLPVYYDIESVDYDTGRLDSAGLTVAQKTNLCRYFCNTIEKNGYQSGVYANYNWLTNLIDGPALGRDYHIWVATYDTYSYYQGIYDIWQYSGMGVLDGIENYVDINVRYHVDFAPKTSLTLRNNGNTLTWNAASGADGYVVFRKNASGNLSVEGVTASTSMSIKTPGANTYYVRAYNRYGGKNYYGAYSNGVLYGIDLAKATGLTAKETALNRFTVSWKAVSGATAYQVIVSKNGVYTFLTETSATSADIGKLNARAENVRVRAVYRSGGYAVVGAFSDKLTLTDVTPAAKPTLSLNGRELSWNSVSGATGYIIYKTVDGKVTSSRTTATKFTIPNVTADYEISAYVSANGFDHIGPKSAGVHYREITYPPEDKVTVTSDFSGISWNSVYGAEGYLVYSVDLNGTVRKIADTTDTFYEVGSSDRMAYYVKAYNTYHSMVYDGAASNRVSIKLAKPVGITLTNNDNIYTFDWKAVANADGYEVMVITDSERYIEVVTNSPTVTVKEPLTAYSNVQITPFSHTAIGVVRGESAHFTLK